MKRLVTLAVVFATATAWDVREHLASMTPYAYTGSGGPDAPYTPPARCTLLSLDAVARHGSRFPTLPSAQRIAALAALLARHAGDLRAPWMRGWASPFAADDAGLLAKRGVAEHVALGKRAAARFGGALLPYNANRVDFRCTQSARTSQSAAAFGAGMLSSSSEWAPIAQLSESFDSDRVLRFFSSVCPRYQAEVAKNPAATAESRAFLAARRAKIAKNVATVTGLPAAEVAADGVLETMWDACGSQVAAMDDVSQWCSVFMMEDVLALEYADDLESFWVKGYGFPLDWQIAEPLLADIVAGMDAAAQSFNGTWDGRPNARLRFAHAETVLPFAALMQLFHDDDGPLLANWTDAQIAARKWRFGNVSPLASSFQFALYSCDGALFVEMLHNELSTPLPACNGLRLCPLSQFKTIFKDILSTDWDKLCSL